RRRIAKWLARTDAGRCAADRRYRLQPAGFLAAGGGVRRHAGDGRLHFTRPAQSPSITERNDLTPNVPHRRRGVASRLAERGAAGARGDARLIRFPIETRAEPRTPG